MLKSALVIEDSEDVSRLWVKLIKRNPRYVRVHSALKIEEADLFLAHNTYTSIVCDLHMGLDSGLGVVLKHKHKVLGSQIIVVTAAEDWELTSAKTIMMDEGMDNVKWFRKPLVESLTDFMECF